MPRPRKQGLDYFPFDCDFFSDEKIAAISGEFGPKGEATAIRLLCAIYRNGYFIEWSEMLRMTMLGNLRGVSPQLLDQIVNRLVKYGFFDKTLYDSDKILTSAGIQRRFFEATRGRVRKSDDLPYLLDFSAGKPNPRVSYKETPVSTSEILVSYKKTPQSKVKNIKISPDGDTKSTSPPPILSPSVSDMDLYALDLHGQLQCLRSQAEWAAVVCRSYHLQNAELWQIVDKDFTDHCIREGKEHHHSLQDLKSHISRWINRIRQSTPHGTNSPPNPQRPCPAQRESEFQARIIRQLNTPDSPGPDLTGYY